MYIHEIPSLGNKPKKRIGRGGKRGTYSGRGQKGQRARSGRKLPGGALAMVRTIPKLRGAGHSSFRRKPVPVKTGDLVKFGPEVTVKMLAERKVIKKGETAKILVGGRELTVPVSVSGVPVSKKARRLIEKAGGSVK